MAQLGVDHRPTTRNVEDVYNKYVFGQVNTFRYTNHRGETADRRAIFLHLYYGRTPEHADEQWFVVAYDLDRKDWRTFALKDIEPR